MRLKMRFFGFLKKLCHYFWLKTVENDRGHRARPFAKNRMSGKTLVLKISRKTLSANQIAGFFKVKYLKNGLTIRANFLHDDKGP